MTRDTSAEPAGAPSNDYVVCPCFQVRKSQIEKCLATGGARDVEEIRVLSHAGAGCAGCEFEVEELIENFYRERRSSGLSRGQALIRRLLIFNKRLIESNREMLRTVKHTISPKAAVFGAWWVQRPGLQTRITLTNMASPSTPKRVSTERVTVEVYSEAGAMLASREHALRPGRSLVLEVRDLLDGGHEGHGLIRVNYHSRRTIGSKRFYSHYYGPNGLTFVHEKLSGYRKGPGGYWTLSGVPSMGSLDTYLILSNGMNAPKSGSVTLTNAMGEQRRASFGQLVPYGTRLFNLRAEIEGFADFLDGHAGTAQVSLRTGIMTCYIMHDRGTGAWQIQHL